MEKVLLILTALSIFVQNCKSSENTNDKIKNQRNFKFFALAEFLPYQEFELIYPELKKLDIEMILAVREGEIDSESLRRMKFRAWPVLKKEKGYWLSVWTADDFYKLVEEVLNKINVEWISLDFEPTWQITTNLSFSGSLNQFVASITQLNPTDEIYNSGKQKIQEIVDLIHSRGKKVMCVFLPFIADDLLDGDQDISRIFGIYVPPNCDEYSFMLYTTIMKTFGEKYGFKFERPEYFVYVYSKDIYNMFGEKSAIDVGLVGEDLFGNKGYNSPEELRKDISAGLAAGIKNFHVWALDNMKKDGKWEVSQWLDIRYIEPVEPQEDEAVLRIRNFFKALD
ncbi:MAG: hypothetical protein NZ927_01400 [Candidatus Calescibacterium sp.]|nr:hypothetical protein [Candidatus Calescibacterium sp.]